MTRVLVLTPQTGGTDGISVLSREAIAAISSELGHAVDGLRVMSLHDETFPAALAARLEFSDDRRGRPSGRPCPSHCLEFSTARGGRLGFAAGALREAAREGDLLIVGLHVHLLPPALPLLSSRTRLVPLLLGIEAWTPLAPLQRAALRRSWRVGAISRHTVERFRQANPALADVEVRVCHPGLPIEGAGRPDIGSPDGVEPYALIVGRMSQAERYKGHDALLEAWPAVSAAVPGARLVIAGGGDDEGRLRARADGLGLDGAIRFEGAVDATRLAALYRDAAFFVMPSRDEGFGLVYLEAMRAGKPCIAAPGAAEEIVQHGTSGLIVEPSDPGGLGAAIVRLFADAGLREAMGRAAADRVRARFGAEHFTARLFDLLGLPQRQPQEAPC